MKKILITFIGDNDCRLSKKQEGAIISLLKQRTFDVLYILYNDVKYLPHASEIREYCKKHHKALDVYYQEAITDSPIDYNIVYPAMVTAVKNIQKEARTKDIEYTISLTSGTPTMHSCWVLISQSGIINAKLIQNSREEGVQDVSFVLDDFPQIRSTNQAKAELTKMSRENKNLRKQQQNRYSDLIGMHESMQKLKQQIDDFAEYDTPIFIFGESGTGKEIVARHLHYQSSRKEAPFVPVDCGAISETLFESQFFGHKKGSFTGAIADKDGYFIQADKGTLFLDEICNLHVTMQVKLLRVLQEGVVEPLGGDPKPVQVRIISASNMDLAQLVKEGTFKADLYYRIMGLKMELSPLRERGTDILLLANHFLNKVNDKYPNKKKHFSVEAEKKLLSHHHPGNVRRLQTIVEVSHAISHNSLIDANDIIFDDDITHSFFVDIPPEGIDFDNEVIPAYYWAALKRARGNASEAARLLGLKPHTFRARRKALDKGKDNDHK